MTLADKLSNMLVEIETGCWEFTGGRTGSGYGAIYVGNGKCRSAHVVSYEITKGNIPKGMIVCHTCDNKICCNPDHLFLGTHQDNKDDEIAKGRHIRGERQGNHKLTESNVHVVREMIERGYTLASIGRKFNVTSEAIRLIKSGANWSWLQ